jgi:hypothetical protein
MAISVPSKSSQYTDYTASPQKMVKAVDWGAGLRASHSKLTFTAAGFTSAAAGDISLIRMPSGRVRILVDQSRVICPAGTATSDLDIGVSAHIALDTGATVALVGNALADSLDVGGGALDQALPLPANGFYEVNSREGFDIVCSFDTANSPAAGDMYVWVVYAMGR